MARRRNQKKSQETLVDLVEARDQAQSFMEKHQNTVFGVLVGLVIVIGGFMAYRFFVQVPKEKESQAQMTQAQYQFERDSFALALTNPGGGNSGFLDIIENYGGSKAANLSNYYAGISYLNLGQYQVAIDYLNDFKADGSVLPITKFGAMGDAYSELNDLDNAMKYYKKAVAAGENEFLVTYYLKKLGMLNEKQGKFAESKKYYEQIKTDFPNSAEARDIEKYIARVEAKI